MIQTIEMPMPGMLGSMNCYLIQNENRFALIDTGMATLGNWELLVSKLKEHGASVDRLDRLVCTHYHPDHCGQAYMFQQHNVPVMMSAPEAKALKQYFEAPSVDEQRALFYGEHVVPEHFLKQVAPSFQFLRTLVRPFVPDETCEDGEVISLAGVPFEVVATPGHTDGHICLLNRSFRVLITGDQILSNTSVNIMLRRESSHSVPIAAYLKSLRRLAEVGDVIGFAGHGEPIQNIAERCDGLIGIQEKRIERVKQALSSNPRSAFELAAIAFGAKRRPFSEWLSCAQCVSCLEHLVEHKQAAIQKAGNKLRFLDV